MPSLTTPHHFLTNILFLLYSLDEVTKKSGKFDVLFLIGRLLATGEELTPFIKGEQKSTSPPFLLLPISVNFLLT